MRRVLRHRSHRCPPSSPVHGCGTCCPMSSAGQTPWCPVDLLPAHGSCIPSTVTGLGHRIPKTPWMPPCAWISKGNPVPGRNLPQPPPGGGVPTHKAQTYSLPGPTCMRNGSLPMAGAMAKAKKGTLIWIPWSDSQLCSHATPEPRNRVSRPSGRAGLRVSMPYFSSEVQVRAHRLGRLLGGLRVAGSTPAKQPKPAYLELPGRTHQFYAAGISAFSDRGWPLQAPWVLHDWISQSPSLVWPDDRAWVMVTEVDYDSTIIAGSQELVTELLETDRVEAFAVGEDVEEYLWVIPEWRWSQPPGECPGLWSERCRGPAAPPWLQDRSA